MVAEIFRIFSTHKKKHSFFTSFGPLQAPQPLPHNRASATGPRTRQWAVTDLDEERRHALGGVVVARDGVDHADGVDQAADALRHADRLAAVQRLAELLQRVQVLEVVLGLVRGVRQLVVLRVPHLSRADDVIITSCAGGSHNTPPPPAS